MDKLQNRRYCSISIELFHSKFNILLLQSKRPKNHKRLKVKVTKKKVA